MSELSIGFVTIKAPGGGYKLSRIASLADGQIAAEVVAYRTTLPEIQAIEHGMKQQEFGEVAWYPPPPQAYQPVRPPQPPQEASMPDDGSLPDVVNNWHSDSLMDQLARRSVPALVPMLFLAGIWIMNNVRIV